MNFLSHFKYSELLKANKELENDLSGNQYHIAVLSNITTAQLNEILEYSLRVQGINAHVTSGDYDNIVQDSEKFSNANLVIIFWELANIVDGLQYKIHLLNHGDIQVLERKIQAEIDFVLSRLKETPLVLINTFSSLAFNYRNIEKNTFDTLCKSLNSYLVQRISSNIRIIDLDRIIAQISVEKSVDMRYYYSSKALYSIEFYKGYAEFIQPLVLSVHGRAKKALIFDCDNTLWKGILGEDGFDRIEMSGKTKDGVIFEEVQHLALDLQKRGVLLGLCSKNNPQDVEHVLTNHPDMTIRNTHLAIKKVNWDDKVSNLRKIAEELNIGLDSLVFVEDSAFEVNFVKEYLPQVTVLQVPSKLYRYPSLIRNSSGLFHHISTSKEDLRKTEMYQRQAQRENEKSRFSNLEDYLKSLELKLSIYIDKSSLVPRISQMTQKTNQFNLTTKRYTEPEIKRFTSSDKYKVFAFGLTDKFGDYGITGLCIIEIDFGHKKTIIDSFLMSCRVIGRNIEFSFFDYIIRSLKDIGIEWLQAMYIRTLRNEQVADLYKRFGCDIVQKEEHQKVYSLKLSNYSPTNLNYIEVANGR